MSGLAIFLDEYLRLRRALGFQLRDTGTGLRNFVLFAEREGASFITTDLALRWATEPTGVHSARYARRLAMVRLFAKYVNAQNPRSEIPPQGLLPYRYSRKPPYIFGEDEVRKLVAAAKTLPSSTGIRAWTFSTIFGLLAVAGMRVSEAVNIARDDVDLKRGLLTIRKSKFGKSRLLPVCRTTRRALIQYAHHRDEILPRPRSGCFFLSRRGTQISKLTVWRTFVSLAYQIGLRGRADRRAPRVHDLRHTFAVRVLLNWYRTGADVDRKMPELSAYLGHRRVADTMWYIEAVPELLQLAAKRLEGQMGGALL